MVSGLIYERDVIELWKVQGVSDYGPAVLFPDKTTAEAYAQLNFPNETVDQRYARIHFIRYFKEER